MDHRWRFTELLKVHEKGTFAHGVLTPPAPQGVASYKLVVEGDDVSIEL
jgi:hypothetical protein